MWGRWGAGNLHHRNRMKKTVRYSEKHPFKSVSCCPFPFYCSDKTRIGSEYVARNKTFTVFTIYIRTDRPEQTVETQMRRRRTRRLIWVYTVCHSSSNF